MLPDFGGGGLPSSQREVGAPPSIRSCCWWWDMAALVLDRRCIGGIAYSRTRGCSLATILYFSVPG